MRSRRTKSKKSKGVALLYFLMVFGFMLGFLMLIVNTGIVIYQKMRLQSAVDLASYAGASVQASYLGNGSSGQDSIRGVNYQVMQRYQKLLKDLQFGFIAPWPTVVPLEIPGPGGAAACMAMCQAANYANAKYADKFYKAASVDLDQIRSRAKTILEQLPESARKAAEATIALNIPELSLESDALGSLASGTTNKVDEFVRGAGVASAIATKKKNAVLNFSTEKGMYLANVVATVPHTFVYYGPACFPYRFDVHFGQMTGWFCSVNGAGAWGPQGYTAAAVAFARAKLGKFSGNIGTIATISDARVKGIRLGFIQNPNKPEPFFVSAAEWTPSNGTFMNLENSFGVTGSLFPKETRLAAMSVAEPFGTSLLLEDGSAFGVRLQSIRKALLDPRMKAVKDDFPGMYSYIETLGPAGGKSSDKAEDVLRRFLH